MDDQRGRIGRRRLWLGCPRPCRTWLETSGDKINWGQVSGGRHLEESAEVASSFVLNSAAPPSQIGEKDGDGTFLIEEAIAKAWAATISRGGVSGVST